MAESRKIYAEDREEEVKLLARSVEELESTVNVLENQVSCLFLWWYLTRSLSTFIGITLNYFVQVDILKGEAERQRLQREDLELELHALKDQMQNVRNVDGDMRRFWTFIPNYMPFFVYIWLLYRRHMQIYHANL